MTEGINSPPLGFDVRVKLRSMSLDTVDDTADSTRRASILPSITDFIEDQAEKKIKIDLRNSMSPNFDRIQSRNHLMRPFSKIEMRHSLL